MRNSASIAIDCRFFSMVRGICTYVELQVEDIKFGMKKRSEFWGWINFLFFRAFELRELQFFTPTTNYSDDFCGYNEIQNSASIVNNTLRTNVMKYVEICSLFRMKIA